MEFVADYGLFLAKAITIVIAIALVIGLAVSAGQKTKTGQDGHIHVTDLSTELDQLESGIRKEVMSKEDYKQYQKQQKADKKTSKKSSSGESSNSASKVSAGADDSSVGVVYVVDFDGDMEASQVENLREEITAILAVASEKDEVIVRLQSPGGMVHTYGLASSQLARIKQAGIRLTAAVDAVAASGGYMMACVADRIVAAPFAIIGSIGVVGQLPNFRRLLEHNHIDFEQHTAGEYKRTLTLFGENTEQGRSKFKEELEQTHELFKNFIAEHRPDLDTTKVATGEHWYGSEALTLGLIDSISTSDDLIVAAAKKGSVFKVKYEIKKPLSERLPIRLQAGIQKVLLNTLQKLTMFKVS